MAVSLDFSEALLEAGRKLFGGEVSFLRGTSSFKDLPTTGVPEFAFAGRSNVGKSSLINALTNRKSLARTSNTPGRTREINFFEVAAKLYIVDLPGYGYAKASKEIVAAFQDFTARYLTQRVPLKRVFILIDARHGLKPNDLEMMDALDKLGQSYQLVLTKGDKVKSLDQLSTNIMDETCTRPACFPRLLVTSSRKSEGIEYLRAEIFSLLS